MQTLDNDSATSPLGLAGRTLHERYELTHIVGSGGMATVYRAQDKRLARPVAVKVLHAHLATDKNSVERFRREAEFAAGLSAHPNIASVYDVGQDGDLHYMVMEFVHGPNLKSLIGREAPFSLARALYVAREVAAALDFAHRHGFVHRDIKPQNVLVADDGAVKVADFGIARSTHSSQLTKKESVLGTASYLAPEQAKGKSSTPLTDVYALGAVLFEMLTGHPPFEAETAVAVAMQHIQKKPSAPSSLNPVVPPWLDRTVLKALAKQPKDRFESAGKFREALAYRETQVQREPVPAVRATPKATRARWRSDVLAVVILFIAAGSAAGAYGTYKGLSSLFASSNTTPKVTPIPPGQGNQHKHHQKQPPPPSHGHGNSGQTAAINGEVYITQAYVSATAAQPGQTLTMTYYVTNASSGSVRLGLGASFVSGTTTLTDKSHHPVMSISPGSAQYERQFSIPSNAPAGSYSWIITLDDPAMTRVYSTVRYPNTDVPGFAEQIT